MAGVILLQRGWLRLRHAKASRPDLTWWQFLRDDLVGLGIVVVLMSVGTAMSREQLESLGRSLREAVDLINIARGRP